MLSSGLGTSEKREIGSEGCAQQESAQKSELEGIVWRYSKASHFGRMIVAYSSSIFYGCSILEQVDYIKGI